jgi:hypothetical protein
LLIWIWASIHGSFAIGLGYVVLNLIMEREWSWLSVPVLGAGLSLATAHGFGVVTMLISFAQARDTLALLSEWRRPELVSAVSLPFIVGVGFVAFGAVRGRISVKHLWVLVPFLALGMSATRAIPPAWIALVPLVALGIGDVVVGGHQRFSMASATVFALVILILPFLIKGDGSLDGERFPLAAAELLGDVNTFHDDVSGGYLIWAQGPERLVYLDDRAELYGQRIAEYVGVRNGDVDWQPVFERDGINQALLKRDERLIAELENSGWVRLYSDESFVVLVP